MTDGLWFITYDFSVEYFIHAVLLVGSTYEESINNIANHFPRNIEIYVGNSSNYKENTKVPGGPRLSTDQNRKVTSSRTGEMMYKYGDEVWPNLPGRYVTITSDWSDVNTNYEIQICNIGIFGGIYSRSTTITSTVTVEQGTWYSLKVDSITG